MNIDSCKIHLIKKNNSFSTLKNEILLGKKEKNCIFVTKSIQFMWLDLRLLLKYLIKRNPE